MAERNLALIYSRKSVVRNPAAEISNERQETACIQVVESQGLRYEIYRDQDISGRTEERPEWQRLKAKLDDPEVRVVIVESLSRASRSVRDFFNFMEELEKRGIALISVKESINTSTAMGRAFVGFIAILNQLESDLASERMAMTIAYRQNEGRHWGLTPYGCQRDEDRNLIPSTEGVWLAPTGHWVVGNKETPPFDQADGAAWLGYHDGLAHLYKLFAAGGYSFQRAAEVMNSEGWPFRSRWGLPRLWNEQDTRRILHSWQLYAGDLPLGRQKDRTSKENDVVDGAHDPILDPGLCHRVAGILKSRSVEKPRGRRPHRVYLLANIARCHACGQKLYGQWKNGVQYYRHRRKDDCSVEHGHVPCNAIDSLILDQLRALKIPLIWRLPIQKEPRYSRRERIAAQRARLEHKLVVLKEMRIESELDKEEYYHRKAQVLAQLAELPTDEADPRQVDWSHVLNRLQDIGRVLADAPPKLKQQAFQTIFEKVVIDMDTRDIVSVEPHPWCRPFF